MCMGVMGLGSVRIGFLFYVGRLMYGIEPDRLDRRPCDPVRLTHHMRPSTPRTVTVEEAQAIFDNFKVRPSVRHSIFLKSHFPPKKYLPQARIDPPFDDPTSRGLTPASPRPIHACDDR